MFILKPKDMAERLGITPAQVTILAKDIEKTQTYKFRKTALGSFLFLERDYKIIKEYQQILHFFGKKEIAMEMFENKMSSYESMKETRPDWTRYLRNAKYIC